MIFTAIGWIGAITFIIAYALLALQLISAQKSMYHILNAIGAVALVVNACHLDDFPNVVVNVVWAAIAVLATLKALREKTGITK